MRTQKRILDQIDLSQLASPSPGELSRTLETWTGVVSRQDARNRLSLDFDMLRIQALQDLQAGAAPVKGMSPTMAAWIRFAKERAEAGRPVTRQVFSELTKKTMSAPQLDKAEREGWIVRVKTETGREYRATEKGMADAAIGVSHGPSLGASLEELARAVATVNAKGVTAVTGINVRAASGLGARIDMFRDTNVSLIKSLVGGQIDDIQKLLESAESTGLRVEDLRAQIMDRFGVSDSKADLLARDQTLKLNAAITQERQRGAGVERYVWTTSGDERVREEHAALEGQVFSWDDPPEVGHPGEDFQCRCTAFPIIDEFDDTAGLDTGLVGSGGAVNSALED